MTMMMPSMSPTQKCVIAVKSRSCGMSPVSSNAPQARLAVKSAPAGPSTAGSPRHAKPRGQAEIRPSANPRPAPYSRRREARWRRSCRGSCADRHGRKRWRAAPPRRAAEHGKAPREQQDQAGGGRWIPQRDIAKLESVELAGPFERQVNGQIDVEACASPPGRRHKRTSRRPGDGPAPPRRRFAPAVWGRDIASIQRRSASCSYDLGIRLAQGQEAVSGYNYPDTCLNCSKPAGVFPALTTRVHLPTVSPPSMHYL